MFKNNTLQWAAVPEKSKINFELWASAVRDGGDFSMGIIGSDWSYGESPAQWGDVPDISECSWNLQTCVNQTSVRKV